MDGDADETGLRASQARIVVGPRAITLLTTAVAVFSGFHEERRHGDRRGRRHGLGTCCRDVEDCADQQLGHPFVAASTRKVHRLGRMHHWGVKEADTRRRFPTDYAVTGWNGVATRMDAFGLTPESLRSLPTRGSIRSFRQC